MFQITGFQANAFQHGGIPSAPVEESGRQVRAGKSRRRRRRISVEVDGKLFVVSSEDEALELLDGAMETATEAATASANEIVRKRQAKARRDGELNRRPISIDLPIISTTDEALRSVVSEYNARLEAIYANAKMVAEISLLAQFKAEIDKNNVIALLLLE